MNKDALWASGQDETVEVNQRALIDKILARYSGEHTVFRELLQNADDAGAHHVQIKFYTKRGLDRMDSAAGSASDTDATDKGLLPDVKKDQIHRYVITNDGIPFRPEDWNRLKKIAEGNPDESKIGAFGVGFYSLWSLADDPFVESGSKWMGFYWKDGKDQLMARSGDLPPSNKPSSSRPATLSGNPWTSFTMNIRDPSVLEGPLDLARFLVTSLSFTRSIRQVDMVMDDIPVLEVTKSVQGKERVSVRGMVDTSTKGMMKVKSVDATGMVITAKVTQWLAASGFIPPPLPDPVAAIVKPTKAFASFLTSSFFGRQTPAPIATPPPLPPPRSQSIEDVTQVTTLHREIQVYQAEIGVSVTTTYARELERATKKPPPKTMPASMVFSRTEEVGAVMDSGSSAVAQDVGGVFAGLCPPLGGERAAKVFIGQATGQTTGIGGHLAARFIPTVERESIDLVDKHVAVWNRELLWIAGHISRMIYELEMARVQKEWAGTSVADVEKRGKLSAEALHALRFFTFNVTTPSAAVGQEMESAFYQSVLDNKNLPLISTTGIQPIKDVRMPSAELAKFVPDLPVVPPSMLEQAPRSVARLQERGLLRDSTFDDVVNQLGKRPLTETEMISALSWWQSIGQMEAYSDRIRDRLLDACILVTDTGKIVPLSTIQTIVKPSSSSIPPDMPLPPHALPYTITKDLRAASAWTIFGWTELTLVQYITFLKNPPMSRNAEAVPETDIRISPVFAEQVLTMLGRAWLNMSANHQTAIALELKDVACIPTKAGFKKPGESYFEKNLLFDDLPTLALPKTTTIKGGLEKMLLAIGVRKTVDLQLVFTRLIGGGTWTCQDLMKYLVSVKDTLSKEEKDRLKATAAFPLDTSDEKDLVTMTDVPAKVVRRKPKDLYEPIPAMKELGLPLLDWGEGKWRANSDEARMLFELGLRRFPPIDVLLGIAAGPAPRNEKALAYLLKEMPNHYTTFDPRAYANAAYIPAQRPDHTRTLAKHSEVYTDSGCAILGFLVADPSVINPEAAAKLRLATDPSMEMLVAALIGQIPNEVGKARSIFEYLARRAVHTSPAVLNRLEGVPFIPVQSEKTVKMYNPHSVYFAAREGQDSLYKGAFTFIDFGERANAFLRICGVKSEPSVKDIARLIMREPERMLEQAGSPERYLEQLRLLAANWSYFDMSLKTAMKNSRFLLASQRVPVKKTKKTMGGLVTANVDGEHERQWVLAKSSEVSIIDEFSLLQYFGDHILAAPEEQLLETFYGHLGARHLSSMVKVDSVHHGLQAHTSSQADTMRKHVLERLMIFLADPKRVKIDHTADSLAKEGNFVIREARTLDSRYVFSNGRDMYPHTERMYALGERKGKTVILTISTTAQHDDYDIAAALCPLIIKYAKPDDTLLLHSILITPLMALKKRGFNVDRILNQKREEKMRLQAEAGRDREKNAAAAAEAKANADAKASSAIPWPGSDATSSRPESVMSSNTAPPDYESRLSSQTDRMSTGNGDNDHASGKGKGFLDRLRGRKSSGTGAGSTGGMPSMPGGFGSLGAGVQDAINRAGGGGLGMHAGPRPGVSTTRPTDQESIRSTVQRAIDASRPETSTKIADSMRGAADVSESQNEYCDVQAQADIREAMKARDGMLSVWVPTGTPDDAAFLEPKMQTIQAFATAIIRPIAEVFKLNDSVFHVFWDLEGPLIAFNRGGAIFCNARYFSAWHLADCRNGKTNDAYISWYMSIAHELAHNLEAAHNSAHEFYFSSIAEEYLVRFTTLLRPDQ